MGGQTFAKYIETETAKTGQVTVAKWGVVLNKKTEGEKISAGEGFADGLSRWWGDLCSGPGCDERMGSGRVEQRRCRHRHILNTGVHVCAVDRTESL